MHHIVHGILLEALPHSKYTKIIEKSTTKAIFESLCSTYEGNQQVHEAKANQLVHHYDLFRMKEDEDTESMYTRFQPSEFHGKESPSSSCSCFSIFFVMMFVVMCN